MKILHIITSLSIGGANMMLYKLLASTDQTRFESSVIVMMDKGELGPHIEGLDTPVYTFGTSRGRYAPPALWRLSNVLKVAGIGAAQKLCQVGVAVKIAVAAGVLGRPSS